MKNKTILDITTKICFFLLAFALVTIFTRFLTRQILVEKLGWDNAFTKIIFWEDTDTFMWDTSDTLDVSDEDGKVRVEVDWESKYPFNDGSEINEKANWPFIFTRYISIIDVIEEKINSYTDDLLLGHMQLTEMGRKYDELIGCDITSVDNGEPIILLKNGYMTYSQPAVKNKELEILSNNVSEFSDYLNKQGIYFVYANAGSKICPTDKQLPPGSIENTNENADKLIRLLKNRDVNVLDYRPLQETHFDNWYDSYYITDHHWKNSTGLWAAGVLANYLNVHAGFNFDLKYFDKTMYSFETTANYFLGGQGKILTTTVKSLEPFDKILPKFKTDFSIQIPTRDLDERGSYSQTLFDEKFYESISDYSMKDFETKPDTYHSVIWRNDALGTVQNHLAEDNEGKRLLMIQDSFGWYLSTFLATDIPEIDFMYLSAFNGGLRTYIKRTKPNAVVLLRCERDIGLMESDFR